MQAVARARDPCPGTNFPIGPGVARTLPYSYPEEALLLKKSTVIWSCRSCDHWQWGTLDNPPETCSGCHAPMEDPRPDRIGAIETYYCARFHEAREEY